MKKIILLFAGLISLSACSSNAYTTFVKGSSSLFSSLVDPSSSLSSSLMNSGSNNSTSISSSSTSTTSHEYARDYVYVDALKANGLTEEDKLANISAQVDTFSSPAIRTESSDDILYVIKSVEEANNFMTLLRKNDAFGDLAALPYENINYFITSALGCTSTSFKHTFKGLYLKNGTIYAHLEYDSRAKPGVGYDTAMQYQHCHFTLDKSVTFTDAKAIVSYYE